MNPNSLIRSVMTAELTTVMPDDTVTLIRSIFENNEFHHLPVTTEGRNLIGIVSKDDLNKVLYLMDTAGSQSSEGYKMLTAKDIMTEYPMNLDPDDSIGLAADIFLANKFHALPVVEDDKLIGIVTTHDLLKYSFKSAVGY